jgi:hypothetical protein
MMNYLKKNDNPLQTAFNAIITDIENNVDTITYKAKITLNLKNPNILVINDLTNKQ